MGYVSEILTINATVSIEAGMWDGLTGMIDFTMPPRKSVVIQDHLTFFINYMQHRYLKIFDYTVFVESPINTNTIYLEHIFWPGADITYSELKFYEEMGLQFHRSDEYLEIIKMGPFLELGT